MDNNLLSLLGLCKRAGMLQVGEEPVEAVARARVARVLFLASDAAENTARRIRHFAELGSCIWLCIPFTKSELGSAVGGTSCALLAVTDIGFAANIVHRLATEDPVHYDEAAAKLDLKAKRAAERKNEMLVHEKKLRQGHVRKNPSATPVKPSASEPAHPVGKWPARSAGNRPSASEPAHPVGKWPARSAGNHPSDFATNRPPRDHRPDSIQKTGDPQPTDSESRTRPLSAPGSFHSPGKFPASGSSGKRGCRPFKAKRGTTKSANPYPHSYPVKKGKGSSSKKG